MKQSKSQVFCFASLKIAWRAIFRGSLMKILCYSHSALLALALLAAVPI
jgi:hypothetical protein